MRLTLWVTLLLSLTRSACQTKQPGLLEVRDITQKVLPAAAQAVLGAGRSVHCPLSCKYYHAGASPESVFVAQPLPSGVGDLGADLESTSSVARNCYPPYGVGPPSTDDWNICVQQEHKIPKPNPDGPAEERRMICEALVRALDGKNTSILSKDGVIGDRSTGEITDARWMLGKADIGCGWGSTMSNVAPDDESGWSEMDWLLKRGFRIQKETAQYFEGKRISSEFDCCLFAMSFEGTPWIEGGAAVRFQYSDRHSCRVDRETTIRGNRDRTSGVAMKDSNTCGDGNLFWRHTTGPADGAHLKGMTKCEAKNGFGVLKGDVDALQPVGSLPDHFTGNWGNEFPNHACDKWPKGECKGVIGYNTIASPEECCQACATLQWVKQMGGNVDTEEVEDEVTGETRQVHKNPCVAWQVVGGKCRIMREQMVREYSRFQGGSVEDAIRRGSSCQEGVAGERNCNYYSFARYRETFEVPTSPGPRPTKPPPVFPPKPQPRDDMVRVTFSKNVLMDVLDGKSVEEYLRAAAEGRHLMLDIEAIIHQVIGRGSSKVMDSIKKHASTFAESLQINSTASENATCATIRLYTTMDLSVFEDGSLELPVGTKAPQPWCEAETCLSSGQIHLLCNVTRFAMQLRSGGRRLAGAAAQQVVTSFGGDGNGKDSIFYEDVSVKALTVQGDPAPRPQCVRVSHQKLKRMEQLGLKAKLCDGSNFGD